MFQCLQLGAMSTDIMTHYYHQYCKILALQNEPPKLQAKPQETTGHMMFSKLKFSKKHVIRN